MSNKTSDENVAIIKDLIQEYKTYNDLDGIQDLSIYVNALEHILAEREQKDKQIKELEKALLKVEDKNTTLFITCRNSIPKQVVIEKINEINKAYEDSKDENGESPYYYPDYTVRVLQEFLGGESK